MKKLINYISRILRIKIFKKFMYVTPNLSDKDAVNLIVEKIRNKEPFCFTRYGDGEINILKNMGSNQFKQKICLNWGYSYPDEIDKCYEELSAILTYSIKKSDMLAFMDFSNNDKIIEINPDPKLWHLNKTYFKKIGLKYKKLNIADHMLPRKECFGSIKSIKKILNGKPIHIISPNCELLIEKKLSKKIGIPISYTNHPYDIKIHNREDVIKLFSDIKEDIVLFGTGVNKDYGVILRDEFNKTALDVGATLDAWANVNSRPWFKEGGKQSYLKV